MYVTLEEEKKALPKTNDNKLQLLYLHEENSRKWQHEKAENVERSGPCWKGSLVNGGINRNENQSSYGFQYTHEGKYFTY